MNRRSNLRSTLAGAVVALLLPFAAGPAAAGAVNEVQGLAIHGYDPVAYVTEGKAVKGLRKYRVRHEGAEFRFASAAHRDSFRADPARWMPAYGGFCAFGTARGYKAKIEPEAFTVVDGRLYLNYDLGVRAEWARDIPGYIEKADRNWPEVVKTTKVYR